jgi:transcriptional regulator with XRE-family HTH domain
VKPRTQRQAGGDEQFPDRLTTERLRQGYSQTTLSSLCGGSPTAQTLSSWERGLRKPRMDDSLFRVALALRTTALYLLYGEE